MVSHLFGDPEGRDMIARIDRRIDRLPGLAGLGLMERAVDRYAGAGSLRRPMMGT